MYIYKIIYNRLTKSIALLGVLFIFISYLKTNFLRERDLIYLIHYLVFIILSFAPYLSKNLSSKAVKVLTFLGLFCFLGLLITTIIYWGDFH